MEKPRPDDEHRPTDQARGGNSIPIQKKALLFRTLAILWIVPSLTSVFVILYRFPAGNGFSETLRLIRLEQWLSILLLLLHLFFIYYAWHYRKTEVPTPLNPSPHEGPNG